MLPKAPISNELLIGRALISMHLILHHGNTGCGVFKQGYKVRQIFALVGRASGLVQKIAGLIPRSGKDILSKNLHFLLRSKEIKLVKSLAASDLHT